MGTLQRRGATWRAFVSLGGKRRSATFDGKSEAQKWILSMESQSRTKVDGASVRIGLVTFGDLVGRYLSEVSPKKRAHRWNAVRLNSLREKFPDLMDLRAPEVTPEVMARWRNKRLKEVSNATVNREMNLLSSLFTVAQKEWGLNSHPLRGLDRPPPTPHRTRRAPDHEVSLILEKLGHVEGERPTKIRQFVAYAALFAVETGMRKGEILGLLPDDVFIESSYLVVRMSKNGQSRDISLSSRAKVLLSLVLEGSRAFWDTESGQKLSQSPGPAINAVQPNAVFPVGSASFDALWRKARASAAIANPEVADLHFHDLRHEAVCRLARRLEILDLARMIGHKDLKNLMIYYNATAQEIAERLG